MSFYLSYTQNINERKAQHVFYFKDDVLFTILGESEVELINLSGDNKNPILSVLDYIKANNINDSEILLPLISEELLDEACDVISNYLLENDASIGILTNNPNFREDYYWILDKYGITYSVPRERINFCVLDTKRKVEPKKKTIYADAGILDIEYLLLELNTCALERVEDDLDSGLVMDEPFNTKFVKLLNESGKTNVEVYTKGGITRQVFSNILSKKDFIPRKDTVICLIIGMELNYTDAVNLLACAGYALSKSIVSDVVVMKYLKRGEHNLDAINDELDERGCSLLGWKPREN